MCSAPSAPRPACPPSVCRAASRPRVCRWGCNSWGGRGTRTSCSPRRARGRRRRRTIDSARRCRKIDATMTWQSEMDELRRRESLAEELGGPERVKRQHAGGRMTIRERIAKPVDAGTFHEVGKIAGKATYDAANDLETFTPSNFVFGRAKVDGRPVVVGGDDFTVRGGSADATIKEKHLQCETMAHELRLPLIRLVEGSGGGGSVKTIETTGRANVPGVSGWEWVVANIGTVPRGARDADPARRVDWLMDAIPRDIRKPYKMRPIVEAVVDAGSFFEIAPLYGRSVITGLARLDGWPVAVMASDPFFYGGAWAADTCQKVERFVDTAQTFHLPVFYLVDCPGFLIGLDAERTGTIKQGVRAMSAIWQTTIPWCSVIVRNCFGVAGAAHRNGGRYCTRYAWPSGRWGSLPLEGGIEAAYRGELDAAADPGAKLAEIEERLTKLRSPFRSAETFWIEEIVDPRDTRRLLCEFAELAAPRRRPGPSEHRMRP